VLYPWPSDLRLFISKERPKQRPKQYQIKMHESYTRSLIETSDGWFLEWTLPALKDFYVEALLFHEIGHNVEHYQRFWTVASHRLSEEFADQYAYEYTSKRRIKYRDIT
jgi:hypothetical protein